MGSLQLVLFFEENSSTRLSSQFRVDRKLNGSSTNFLKGDGVLTFKNSVSFFDRKIEVPGYQFEGQVSFSSEIAVTMTGRTVDFPLELLTERKSSTLASVSMPPERLLCLG